MEAARRQEDVPHLKRDESLAGWSEAPRSSSNDALHGRGFATIAHMSGGFRKGTVWHGFSGGKPRGLGETDEAHAGSCLQMTAGRAWGALEATVEGAEAANSGVLTT
jgi:hypothetical protein